MIYGMGARALGDQLGIEEEEAQTLLDQFQGSFPGLKKFAAATVNTARSTSYVTTLLGRRRYLPSITSQCPQSRGKIISEFILYACLLSKNVWINFSA